LFNERKLELMIDTKTWIEYKNKNGTKVIATPFINGMEDGICHILNKRYITHNKIQRYVSEGIHLFFITGDDKLHLLTSEVFLNQVTL